ncbi:MAG: tetratricopeptide repeat protein, partial [Acidobacteria bacterium]|nr:tetratricopeptide repeat protein [Acidobacteriota bacterium]
GVAPSPPRQHSRDPEARRLYQMGYYAWAKRTEAETMRSIGFFRQALARDPDYALAHAGLADALLSASNRRLLPPAEAIPSARESVRKALSLSPRLAEALTASARIRFFYEWQFAPAEIEFRRAIELTPNSLGAHQWYGLALSALGRFDRALAQLKEAEALSPLSPMIGNDVAVTRFYERRYDLAAAQARRVIEVEPGFPAAHLTLGYALASQGQASAGLRELDRAVELAGPDVGTNLWRVRTLALLGQRERAVALLAGLLRTAPDRIGRYRLACVRAVLGQSDLAFQDLEVAAQERELWLVYVNVDPAFDSLRSDPRFPALLRRIGLQR